MADVRSDQPTAVISADVTTEAIKVTITNPTPTSGRPAVTSNQVWRRPTGSTGVWTLAGTTGTNGVFVDSFQRAGSQFDYFIRTDSGADSITYTGTTPAVSGMWLSAAGDPTTLAHYPYTDGGSETLDETEAVIPLVGRVYPIVESGIQENQTVALNVEIPFSDTDWRTQVEWWRTRRRAGQTLLYRDGRGRVFACRLVGPMTFPPSRRGTSVTGTLQRVDYVSATTTIDPVYYVGGIYNDMGNGVSGNGSIGNGY